ncbi:endolysin, L-Ala-D-Glu peptidase domain [Arthrobacter phage Laila]|nr:endolysin, L-Ala-D-Glu peptidase domain [Arthrobacter phage Elkhorn]ASR83698.1 endolysin, L-Ala-D-Glu peptidase domain [Arthrobacter phage Lore]QBP30102.1 endolysin, L-Ala-D-Glu peptidase domain [Arthrobacter phage Blair]QBP30788.1 endolysin, L-Ala-D-Glu peptidase domain [Arthrobacter phage StewieGriff]QDB74342.1 endolysin, L-Ala-D-Glu peptidase domain [Arthrobacter phage Laila]
MTTMTLAYPLVEGETIQEFGARQSFYRKLGQLGHNGIDLGCEVGTPVYAMAAGTVLHAGWSHDHPWLTHHAGIAVLTHHGEHISGLAHLSKVVVAPGDRVEVGQLVGYSGDTGTAGVPHVHCELLAAQPDWSNGYAGRIRFEFSKGELN